MYVDMGGGFILGAPKQSMSPSNADRGHAPSAVGLLVNCGLFNNIETFRKKYANA